MIQRSVIVALLMCMGLGIVLSPVAGITVTQVAPSPIAEVEYALPYPGILPDHPLYIFKVIRDRILVLRTQDTLKKIHLNLLLGDKRLVMGKLLWEKGRYDLSVSTFSKGETYLFTASSDLVQAKNANMLPPGLSDKLELAAKKHQEVITKIMSDTSEQTYKKSFTDMLGLTKQAIDKIASVK